MPHTHFDAFLNRFTVQQSVLMVRRLEINRNSREESRACDVGLRWMIERMQRQTVSVVDHIIPSHHVFERADVLFEILVDPACLRTADDIDALTTRNILLIPEAFGRRKCSVRLDLNKEPSPNEFDQKLLQILTEWLSAGDDHKLRHSEAFDWSCWIELADFDSDLLYSHVAPADSVVGVAERALKVAAGKSEKDGRRSAERTFALDCVED